MTTQPGERFGTVWAWPETDGIWRCLPVAPSPQRNEAGRASMTVIEAGGMLMLTLGAEIAVSEADLARIQAEIAGKSGMDASLVKLKPAEITVTAASLVLTAADGTEVTLATARPSSFPPYPAAFTAMLQGEAALPLKDALKGTGGTVSVRYDVAWMITRAATAVIKGQWSGDGGLDAALDRAELAVVVTADDGASPDLIQKAVLRVKAQAGEMLARMQPPPATVTASPSTGKGPRGAMSARVETIDVDAATTETETVAQALRLQGDIADWVK